MNAMKNRPGNITLGLLLCVEPLARIELATQGLGIFPSGIFAGVATFILLLLAVLNSASGLGFTYFLLFLTLSVNGLLHPVVWSYCGYGNSPHKLLPRFIILSSFNPFIIHVSQSLQKAGRIPTASSRSPMRYVTSSRTWDAPPRC